MMRFYIIALTIAECPDSLQAAQNARAVDLCAKRQDDAPVMTMKNAGFIVFLPCKSFGGIFRAILLRTYKRLA